MHKKALNRILNFKNCSRVGTLLLGSLFPDHRGCEGRDGTVEKGSGRKEAKGWGRKEMDQEEEKRRKRKIVGYGREG